MKRDERNNQEQEEQEEKATYKTAVELAIKNPGGILELKVVQTTKLIIL